MFWKYLSYFHKGRTDRVCGANCTIFLKIWFFRCEDLVIKICEWLYLVKKTRCIWIRMLLLKWFEPAVSNISLTATISGWFSLAHHMSWIKMWQLICKDAFQVISVFFSNNMEFYLSCCSWAHKKEKEIRCPTPISHLKDQFWLERPLKKISGS